MDEAHLVANQLANASFSTKQVIIKMKQNRKLGNNEERQLLLNLAASQKVKGVLQLAQFGDYLYYLAAK